MFIHKSEAKDRRYIEVKKGLRETDPDNDSSGAPAVLSAEGSGRVEEAPKETVFPDLIVSISSDPTIRIRNSKVADLNQSIAKLHSVQRDIGEVRDFVSAGGKEDHESEDPHRREKLIARLNRIGQELGLKLSNTPGLGDLARVGREPTSSVTVKFHSFFEHTERLLELATSDFQEVIDGMMTPYAGTVEQEVIAEMTIARDAARDLRSDIVNAGEEALFGVANQDPLKVFELLST